MKIFGAMAKSGGRHQPAVKMVAAIFCVGGAARLSYHHRPMLWEMAVGKVGWSRWLGRKRGRAVVLGDC